MNTDAISTGSMSTQTMMPRSNVAFKRILEPKHKIQYDDEDDSNDDDSDYATQEILNIERRMKSKTKANPIKPKTSIDIVIEDEASDIIAIETISAEKLKKKEQKGSDSEFEDSIQGDSEADDEKQRSKLAKLGSATFNSWHDLDFPRDKVELPRSYFTDGPTPWSNFQDLALGQRFVNARLTGEFSQRYLHPNMKTDNWSDSQLKVVGDLMKEANALLDMFDQVSMLLGPDIKLHKVSGNII